MAGGADDCRMVCEICGIVVVFVADECFCGLCPDLDCAGCGVFGVVAVGCIGWVVFGICGQCAVHVADYCAGL